MSLPRGMGASRSDHQSRWSVRFAPTTPPSQGRAPNEEVESSSMTINRRRPAERPALRGCLPIEQVAGRRECRETRVFEGSHLMQSEMQGFNLKSQATRCIVTAAAFSAVWLA